jgi:hypothetical protein
LKSIAIIAIVVIFLFVPISAYATHADDEDYSNDPEYEGKIPLRFYQIFASKDVWYTGACDDAKNSFLRSKTIQVLKMYDYLPITSKMECVKVVGEVEFDKNIGNSDSTFGLSLTEAVSRAKNWDYNLLIIVFDDNFSYEYINETTDLEYKYGWAGHIQYDTNTIVSTTTLLNAEQPESARTMAHEISHFAIEKKFGRTIGGDAVHKVDAEFKQCMNSNSLGSCSHLWTTVKTHYGDPIPVMSPDYIIQVAESMKQKVTTPTPKYSNQDTGNPDTINYFIAKYGYLKKSIIEQSSAKITEYQQLHFDSPLAKAKLGYVLIQLKNIDNFDSSDYNVNIHTENWMDGLYSVGESGVIEEIASINEKFNELRNLDLEIIKAKNLENDYENKLQKKNELESKKIEEQKILDEWMINQERSKNEQESQYAIDKAIEIAKNRIEQDSQREEDEKQRKQNLISESELSWLISKRDDTENRLSEVESKFKQSSNSLRQAEKDFIGDIPKSYIDKGWNIRLTLLKEFPELQGLGNKIIHDIDILKSEQNAGNIHSVSVSEIKRNIVIFEPVADKMSSDMKYVSQEIDSAKKSHEKSNPKTCFLFWCW